MDLIEFIYESNKAKTKDELSSDFLKFLGEFGVSKYIVAELSYTSSPNKNNKFEMTINHSEDWWNHYKENMYYFDDPVYSAALLQRSPFSWQEAIDRGITERGMSIFEEAKENNIHGGIALSIHQPLSEIIGMSFSGDYKGVRDDAEALSLVYAASNQFYNVYSDIVDLTDTANQEVDLTSREYEVLVWLARGKTKSDISDILTISESTVKRHSESILKKLDANNTTLAVVKALRMGIIAPF